MNLLITAIFLSIISCNILLTNLMSLIISTFRTKIVAEDQRFQKVLKLNLKKKLKIKS
jgi:hypothetical protein